MFKKCYFFPSNEIFLAHLCIALELSMAFLNNYLALTAQYKTVQWKQWLTPAFNGNSNTMTKIYLKARKNTQTNSIPPPPFPTESPFLGLPLPFKNFPNPPILGFLVRSIPRFKRVRGFNYDNPPEPRYKGNRSSMQFVVNVILPSWSFSWFIYDAFNCYKVFFTYKIMPPYFNKQ